MWDEGGRETVTLPMDDITAPTFSKQLCQGGTPSPQQALSTSSLHSLIDGQDLDRSKVRKSLYSTRERILPNFPNVSYARITTNIP